MLKPSGVKDEKGLPKDDDVSPPKDFRLSFGGCLSGSFFLNQVSKKS
jgi:hypothetical protein